MQELDSLDTDPTDGKIYYFETKLDAGVNTYSFRCADASGSNTTAAKMLLVKEVKPFQLTHLDVMFAVLMWIPFVVYFMYLARKMTKALERIDRQGESRTHAVYEDMVCSPEEGECLEECMCEFRDGKTVKLDELKREKD
jgi:hypothetical protein